MGYDAALEKAWSDLERSGLEGIVPVRFFSDEYSVDAPNRKVLSLSCNAPAKDFVSILLLHYLKRRGEGLAGVSGEWVSFKELESGETYYPAFRKRAIEPLLRKYGSDPEGIFSAVERGIARRIDQADAAISLEAFAGVPVLIEIWKGDTEFPPEASILFDRSIGRIFCTEDVAVLAGFAAKYV